MRHYKNSCRTFTPSSRPASGGSRLRTAGLTLTSLLALLYGWIVYSEGGLGMYVERLKRQLQERPKVTQAYKKLTVSQAFAAAQEEVARG